jgi:hypothetical protein
MNKTQALKLSVVAAMVLTACAGTGGTNVAAKRAQVEATIPTCVTPEECEFKWAAARRWILENAGFKLQNVTADFLETYNPTSGSPSLAARVVKEPLGGGRYRLVVTLWCDNMFGCVPNAWDAALGFNQYVNGSAPKAARLPEGCEQMGSLVRVYAGATLLTKCKERFTEEECNRCLSGF